MAFKVSNETKVGALAAIAITLMILGFNFLKGRSLVKTGHFLYARFDSTELLAPSHKVYIKGYPVGSVYEITAVNDSLSQFTVAMRMEKEFAIPKGSVAMIKGNPLGSPSVVIFMSKEKGMLKDGDYLNTQVEEGLLSGLTKSVSPLADSVKMTLSNVNKVLTNVNSLFQESSKNAIANSLQNVNKLTASLLVTSANLERLMSSQNGALSKSLSNVESVTLNMRGTNESVTNAVKNVEKLTSELANSNINETMGKLSEAVKSLKFIMEKVNDGEGSLGQLINDKRLYNNLNSTMHNANILLQDFRLHPKRYVNVSVFGRKDKTPPLMQPMPDSATQVPVNK
jgi:phospholipid/cholesterol/gamma-HCH transport system substrate-binding protein